MRHLARKPFAGLAKPGLKKFNSVLRKEYGPHPSHHTGISGRLTGLTALKAAHTRQWRQTQDLYLIAGTDLQD